MRRLTSLFLSVALALSGLVLADAYGHGHQAGTEVVICSGVGVTTITIGPDGEPVEAVEVCPDGYTILAATFVSADMPAPVLRRLAVLEPAAVPVWVSRDAPAAAARGPPERI